MTPRRIAGVAGFVYAAAAAIENMGLLEAPTLAGPVADVRASYENQSLGLVANASPNAGPGDHAAGDNSLAQALIQRPIPAHAGGHRTSVPGAWLIGAATRPGPGVSGASGRAVAQALIGATRESRPTAALVD